jgi:hypothetical protein
MKDVERRRQWSQGKTLRDAFSDQKLLLSIRMIDLKARWDRDILTMPWI